MFRNFFVGNYLLLTRWLGLLFLPLPASKITQRLGGSRLTTAGCDQRSQQRKQEDRPHGGRARIQADTHTHPLVPAARNASKMVCLKERPMKLRSSKAAQRIPMFHTRSFRGFFGSISCQRLKP